MKSNPGGQIAPKDVVGRDQLVGRLWDVLLRQSVVLTSERRIGKTSVMRKMMAEATADKLPIYRDLEQVHSAMEFTQLVYDDVSGYLSKLNRTATRAHRLIAQLGGTEVGGVLKLPQVAGPQWKKLLTGTLEDLAEKQDQTIILMWDELPSMLYNIKKHDSAAVAMEILDTLRALRQTYGSLRMVFTGSIGLHLVIAELRKAGHVNDAINDMAIMDVGPIDRDHAEGLAIDLLKSERIPAEDPAACARKIAEIVDNIPFYIHHVVDDLKGRGAAATPEVIEEIVVSALVDDQNRWRLGHYHDRITVYYGEEDRLIAYALLDVLSAAESPLTFGEVFDLLKSKVVTEDAEAARGVLALLRSDHYLTQNVDGRYGFRFGLLKRYWKMRRGITT